jgi:hypothetical protein
MIPIYKSAKLLSPYISSDIISISISTISISISTISISTTYKGTNLIGYIKSQPLNEVDRTVKIAEMLSWTQHGLKTSTPR